MVAELDYDFVTWYLDPSFSMSPIWWPSGTISWFCPSPRAFLPSRSQTLSLSTLNSCPLYLKLSPLYLKLLPSRPQIRAISTSNSCHLDLKLLPSLPQTLALSTPNSRPIYLKHFQVLANICGPGKI